MWAEDGRKFYGDSWDGLWPTLGEPYAGYLHTVPRMWAWVASLLPVGWAPAILALGVAGTVAGIAAYVYVTARGYIRQPLLRLLLAAFIILVPLARYEAVVNLTNLHWFLLAGLAFAALADQREPAVRVASVLLVLGATTSDGLAILLAPVFIGLWWTDRSRGRTTVLVAYVLGSAVHLAVMLTAGGPATTPGEDARLDFVLLPGVYLTRVIAPAFMGETTVQRGFVNGLDVGSFGMVLLGAAVLALIFGYALLRPGFTHRSAALILLVYSGIFFGAPMQIHGDIDRFAGVGDNEPIFTGARYFIAPSILLVAAVLTIISERDPRVPQRLWHAITGFVAAAIVWSLVAGYSVESRPQDYPSWDGQIDDAVALCRGNPDLPDPVLIQIQPPGWFVEMSCERLGGVE